MDSSEFFGSDAPAADPQAYDGYGRYLIDADGTGRRPYTRATTLAKTLENTRGIEIWTQRKVAKGVAQSPALVARAAVTPLDDKASWREILEQAEVKSGGDEKRDLGSAFHALHEHVETMTDDEWNAVPDELKATYLKYRAELDRVGIVEVMTECTVVNTKIGTAGKFDAIFRLADGRLVIGDRKTGRVTEYPHGPAVQLAIYANADVLITYDENGAVQRHPMPKLDLTTAIVIDITIGDANTASVHAYEVDIWAGWYGALLATDVRRWRNRKDLVKPYHPEQRPMVTAAQIMPVSPELLAEREKARTYTTEDIVAGRAPTAQAILHGEAVAEHLAAAEKARIIEQHERTTTLVPGTGVPPGFVAGVGGPLADDTQVPEPPRATPEQRADFAAELGYGTAPAVAQPVEVAHGPAANTDLGGPMTQPAHAAHPITHQAWSSAEQRNITLNPDGTRADGLTGPQVSAVLGHPVSDDDSALNADLAAEGRGPLQPEQDIDALQEAFKTKAQLQAAAKRLDPAMKVERTRKNLASDMVAHPTWPQRRTEFLPVDPVARVQEASDEAAEIFSPVVSNAPGPVPPDPEPSYPSPADAAGAQADAGTNPFADYPTIAPPAPAPEEPIEDQLLRRIGEATSSEDLAKVWEDARDAGIGWPPRLHQAATIRQKHLTAPAAQ